MGIAMNVDAMIEWLLVGPVFCWLLWRLWQSPLRRKTLTIKQPRDWLIDVSGLLMQGVIVPAVKVSVLWGLLHALLPDAFGCWQLPFWQSFLLAFVGVDYLYYWNHRWLHGKTMWPWHLIHHSARQMDLFATARNSLLTPFFIVYVWVGGLCVYLLANPTGFLVGAALTAALDLVRHSRASLADGWWERLDGVLVTPRLHQLHHSRIPEGAVNFGANFILWDRLHGTACREYHDEAPVGQSLSGAVFGLWLFPRYSHVHPHYKENRHDANI